MHYRGAGDTARACEYYSEAADQAAAALAFDHAARLYRIALELHQGTPAQAGVLWRKLGDALANAGRGSEAAQAYAKAAETATAAETLELKRLASTQLLLSGHVEDGLALLRTLLGPLGLSMPRTARQAWLSLFWHRFLLKLRGLRFRKRDESQISAMDSDPDRSLLVGRGGAVDVRADPRGRLPDSRPACWRCGPASRCGSPGPWRWKPDTGPPPVRRRLRGSRACSATAEQIAQRDRLALCPRHDRDGARLRRAHARRLEDGTRPCSSRPNELFRDHCTGVTWERDTMHNFMLRALVQMGEIRELKERWSVVLPRVAGARRPVRGHHAELPST